MTSTAFLTDQYELTMLQAALGSGVAHRPAVFEAFARKLPAGRRYGVVAGVNRIQEALRDFHFTDDQLEHLAAKSIVNEETLEYLRTFRFSGNIDSYRDGELYFPHSPVLTVEAPFGEAVLLETLILSILNHDCAIASAAARMRSAAGERRLVEMGSRRTHEGAAVAAAYAAAIAGFDATSNLEAGFQYGIPTTGTSAHAFTLAHADEKDAFAAQVAALGEGTTLLVDTYDITQGIRNAIEVAGPNLGAIRIDSGDLGLEARAARELLDSLGAVNTKIIVTSDLDEYAIANLADAPIDGYGAGTKLVTGSGNPTASMVYKLVAIENPETGLMEPKAKKAAGKGSAGGRKYAYRVNEGTPQVCEVLTYGEVPEGDTVRPLQAPLVRRGTQFRMSLPRWSSKHHATVKAALPAEALLLMAGTPACEATLEANTNQTAA